jgi:hypothetical protein
MIPGSGDVKMPWWFYRFSGRAEPSPEQLLEELEQVVATGNFRRFLAEADPSRLARLVEPATSGLTLPVDDRAETRAGSEGAVLLPVAEAVLGSATTIGSGSPHLRTMDIWPGSPGRCRRRRGQRLARWPGSSLCRRSG